MEYYNPNDNSTKRYAAIAVVVFMAVVAFAVSFISIVVTPSSRPPVLIELTAEEVEDEEPNEEKQKQQPRPKPDNRATQSTMPAEVPVQINDGSVATSEESTEQDTDPIVHTNESEETKSAENKGEDDSNQTLNPNANFPPVNTQSSEAVDDGNPKKPEGAEEKDKGDGEGDNIAGEDSFDTGDPRNNPGFATLDDKLLTRGFTYMHIPDDPLSISQEVVVRVLVKVTADGSVEEASAVMDGTSTYRDDIKKFAEECAMGSKFKPGEVEVYGYITYKFSPLIPQ